MCKKNRRKLSLLTTALFLTASVCTGCGLIPDKEDDHKINIVTEDISNNYSLSVVEPRDVISTLTFSSTYSQLREEKLTFEEYDRKIGNIYISEGDDVTEGQLLAELDITDLKDAIDRNSSLIAEDTLLIKQANEMIDYYTGRINSPSISLAAKEEYTLSRQNYIENITKYNNEIATAEQMIAKDTETIEKCRIYAPFTGTVSSFREGLDSWTSTKGGEVMTLIDSGICAFKALSRTGAANLSVGDEVTVTTPNGNSYNTIVYSINDTSCEIILALDEPDYSLTVGTRGTSVITLAESKNTPSVPCASVFMADDTYYVYVLSDSGVREMKIVTIGVYGDNYVEILDGLDLYSSVIMKERK